MSCIIPPPLYRPRARLSRYATLWLSYFWRMHLKHVASAAANALGVTTLHYAAMLTRVQEDLRASEEDAKLRAEIVALARVLGRHKALLELEDRISTTGDYARKGPGKKRPIVGVVITIHARIHTLGLPRTRPTARPLTVCAAVWWVSSRRKQCPSAPRRRSTTVGTEPAVGVHAPAGHHPAVAQPHLAALAHREEH